MKYKILESIHSITLIVSVELKPSGQFNEWTV